MVFIKTYKKILDAILKVETTASAILVIFIAAAMCLQIFMRYIVNQPLIWVHEGVMYAFIWITGLGASIALKTGSHIKIDTFLSHIPVRVSKVIHCGTSFLVLLLLVFLAIKFPLTIRFQNKSLTSSLPINIPRGYYYSVPIFTTFSLMIVTQVYQIIDCLRAVFVGKTDSRERVS